MIEKVEIKNLKVAENLSEGSLAFTASIWINGKKAGGAKNQGRGGMTDVDLYYWEGDQARRNNELNSGLMFSPNCEDEHGGNPHSVVIDMVNWKVTSTDR